DVCPCGVGPLLGPPSRRVAPFRSRPLSGASTFVGCGVPMVKRKMPPSLPRPATAYVTASPPRLALRPVLTCAGEGPGVTRRAGGGARGAQHGQQSEDEGRAGVRARLYVGDARIDVAA